MEFRILGPLEVLSDGRPLDLGGQKQRVLLAVLLLEANRVVSSDRLIEALWPDEPPNTAQKALQVYVSQLRKLLGRERVETKAPGYLLRVADGGLDLQRVEQLREESRLPEALSLWRGAPLSDLAYERAVQGEIGRLEELLTVCLEERIDADLDRGRHAEVIGELERLVGDHPLREHLRGQLMLALYRSGRQAEALDAYQETRRVLVEELGIEPGRPLRELEQAILRQDPSLEGVRAGSAEADDASDPSRGIFIGRESELGQLRSGLDAAIAGHGGSFCSSGSRVSARAVSQMSSCARRGPEEHMCSSAAAGRQAVRPPIGPGCNRCARTSKRAIPRLWARNSVQAPPTWRRSSPNSARAYLTWTNRASKAKARASDSLTPLGAS
jgi:DNA-binding SARP family transcriptional activator